MRSFVWAKLKQRRIWRRIFLERLSEPIHLNLLSALVAVGGGLRARIAHDLIVRPFNAFAILQAADWARRYGLSRITLMEFGVASGAGLLNIAYIAQRVTRATGVQFDVYGFDTGLDMPTAEDCRDHPDIYSGGDFPMDVAALQARLPQNTSLIVGDVAETLPPFLAGLSTQAPIGYTAFDLRSWATRIPRNNLPIVVAYLDDIYEDLHNRWCGALLAVAEFNAAQQLRKIETPAFLEKKRLFRQAQWIQQMRFVHILDHPRRTRPLVPERHIMSNPYIKGARL
jgi:hypothetical protein